MTTEPRPVHQGQIRALVGCIVILWLLCLYLATVIDRHTAQLHTLNWRLATARVAL